MEEPDFPYPTQKGTSKIKWTVFIGLFLIAAVVGGVLLTRQPKKLEEKKSVVIEKKEPTPTEKPKIEKTAVKIQVLNGTGTPGQAGIVVKALEDAGYSADNIKSGNAETIDHSTTTITSRADFEGIVSDIKDVLKKTFDEITVGSQNLSDDSAFDIVVVTGGKTFETVTPTTSVTGSGSPTPSPTITITTTPTPSLTPSPTPTP